MIHPSIRSGRSRPSQSKGALVLTSSPTFVIIRRGRHEHSFYEGIPEKESSIVHPALASVSDRSRVDLSVLTIESGHSDGRTKFVPTLNFRILISYRSYLKDVIWWGVWGRGGGRWHAQVSHALAHFDSSGCPPQCRERRPALHTSPSTAGRPRSHGLQYTSWSKLRPYALFENNFQGFIERFTI